MSEFRGFTKEDYYAYAGAVALPTGDKPKIQSHTFEGKYGLDAILSGTEDERIELQLYLYTGEGDDPLVWSKTYPENLYFQAILLDASLTFDDVVNSEFSTLVQTLDKRFERLM